MVKKARLKAGQHPGNLEFVGTKSGVAAKISVIRYDQNSLQEKVEAQIGNLAIDLPSSGVLWIDVRGVQQDVLRHLGSKFNLHPLLLEDILDMDHRPKLDDYGDYLYIVLHDIRYEGDSGAITLEQVNLILGPNYLISISDGERDIFEPVKKRLKNCVGNIRSLGADYLAYSLVDLVVDNYFVALEELGERIELVETSLISNPVTQALDAINGLKRSMLRIRKSLWPLREIINSLDKGDSKLVSVHIGIYLRDVYDHTIQVMDTIETYRDMLSGMLDIYLSSVSNRTNEIMKVLTIISTIFIPLTFIVGLYGMNFKNMPELDWAWGYYAVWGLMLLITLCLVIYFKRKKWI